MRKKIALFIGSDITAHLIMNEVVTAMVEKFGIEPILFFPKHPHSPRAALSELKEFAFFDRTLLNETVYPFIEEKTFAGAKNLSPSQLAEKYDLHVEKIEDVNDPAFVNRIALDPDISAGFSIRCFQIFRPEIISVMETKGLFLNLHPGLLPEYQGVMSTMRRQFDIATGRADSADYGCTLHKIDKRIDTGNIIDTLSIRLDKSQTGFMANINLAPVGSRMIIHTLEKMKDYTLRGYPQETQKQNYFTYPTQDELKEWKAAKITLLNRDEVVDTYVAQFSKAGTHHGDALTERIISTVEEWEKSRNNKPTPANGNPKTPDGPVSAVG